MPQKNLIISIYLLRAQASRATKQDVEITQFYSIYVLDWLGSIHFEESANTQHNKLTQRIAIMNKISHSNDCYSYNKL